MVMQPSQKKQYLDHILQNLPHKPGVYKMKNEEGTIIYIGKAKDLKKRVASYFLESKEKGMRTIKMVEHIADIAYTVVDTELEALILETNLIKEMRPKYNILMKDDKSYIYIKITVNDEYPRIYLVRKVAKDKARYFGPKTSAHKVIKTLKALKKIFPFNHCPLAIDYTSYTESKTSKPLSASQIEDHLKRCIGPCIYSVKPEEYRLMVTQIINFLEGKHEEILAKMKDEMVKLAAAKKFEEAASMRDKLKTIEEITEKQKISDPNQKDLDVINYVEQDNKLFFNLFQLRSGKLIDQQNFILNNQENEGEKENINALSAFLEQYYEKATDVPQEVLIPHEIEEPEIVEAWLSTMKNQRVKIIIPERGKKNKLLEFSHLNAFSFAKQSQIKWQGAEKGDRQQALLDLQKILKLPTLPKRLECYDISHFSGTETVSSMTVFENGFPRKDDYRKFKLHQQTGGEPNDFASMEETLTRRLKYLKPSKASASIRVRKPKKNENSATGNFFIIEKEKKQIGLCHIQETPSKKFILQKIDIQVSEDLSIIIKKIIEKCKTKRLYYACPVDIQAQFEEIGFQQIQKVPDECEPIPGIIYLVYDRTKYAEDSSLKKRPDLIIIDGGKGQLSSAQKALKKYVLDVPMISIAKKEELLFMPDNPIPIQLSHHNPILHMIQHIRDEAHRFAVSYHKNLRLKATTSSILDTIPGIGPELRMKLLQQFGSIEIIKNADIATLSNVVGPKLAARLKIKLNTADDKE